MSYQKKAINTGNSKIPSPLANYSAAIRVGPLLFLSGQGARDPETGVEVGVTIDAKGQLIAYDIEAQTHACLRNVMSVLVAAECTIYDLVDVTVFLCNMSDFSQYNKVYNEYFAFENPPTRTTVQVAALPGKNFIEIKAIAVCST